MATLDELAAALERALDRATKETTDEVLLAAHACIQADDLTLREQGRIAMLALADEGSPRAAWLGAYCWLEGLGGDADLDRGLALLVRAANEGVAEAAFELGQLLARSEQLEAAATWLNLAAEQGHAPALRMLGRMAAGSGERNAADHLLQAAIQAGSEPAVFDRVLLLAQFGPSDELVALLDGLLSKRDVPGGLLGEVGRATAERDPDAVLSLAIVVAPQGRAGRQAFVDGLARGNQGLWEELGPDLRAVLDLG